MEELEQQYSERPVTPRIPVTITEDEFIKFNQTIAKHFGAMRMRIPTMVVFIAYIAILGYLTYLEIVENGSISLLMGLMLGVTVLCAVPSLIIAPLHIKKSAKASYVANEENGYYGEVYMEGGDIVKDVGYKQTRLPLNEKTLYIETPDLMSFSSVTGEGATIILPARCMTEEAAAYIRQQVFAPSVTLQRRVISRMTAGASVLMPRRPMLAAPEELYRVDFTYTPEEYKDVVTRTAWRNYNRRLPVTLVTAMLLGTVAMNMWESVWTLVMTVAGMMLLSVLMSTVRAKNLANRAELATPPRVSTVITDRGIETDIPSLSRHLSIKWKGVTRAAESDTDVQFDVVGNHMLSIPKRAIDDMDALRTVVDRYYKQ